MTGGQLCFIWVKQLAENDHKTESDLLVRYVSTLWRHLTSERELPRWSNVNEGRRQKSILSIDEPQRRKLRSEGIVTLTPTPISNL